MRLDQRSKNRLLFFGVLFAFLLGSSPAFSSSDILNAKAGIVIDGLTGQVLFAKNPDLPLPPASTTKLMTAIVVMEHADLSESVVISKNASTVARYRMGLRTGDKATIEMLLNAALIKSSNDAAVALAEGVAGSEECFVQLMNEKAQALGARNTRFINPHGLPGPGQHTTASDLARIMVYALGYPKIKEIIGTPYCQFSTEGGQLLYLRTTDKLLTSHEGLVGGKTGFTLSAGHCFVCAAERENKTVIVSILGSPSRGTLWKETQQLLDKGYRALSINTRPAVPQQASISSKAQKRTKARSVRTTRPPLPKRHPTTGRSIKT
jgi:serine-type D-Ala-D-Ala carboxypeptidase (penicillin-binding protein 5/6)